MSVEQGIGRSAPLLLVQISTPNRRSKFSGYEFRDFDSASHRIEQRPPGMFLGWTDCD